MLDPQTVAFREHIRDLWIDNCTREERGKVERSKLALEEAWFSANPDPSAFLTNVANAALALEAAEKNLKGARDRLETVFTQKSVFPDALDRLPLTVPSPDDALSDPLRAISHAGRLPSRYSVTVHKP